MAYQRKPRSADDVKCWMFNSMGKCRYNEKCHWLHVDPSTGQYFKTMYVMNSLYSAQQTDAKLRQQRAEAKANKMAGLTPKAANDNAQKEESANDKNAPTSNDDDSKEDSAKKAKQAADPSAPKRNPMMNARSVEDEKDYDPKKAQKEFSAIMEKAIEKKQLDREQSVGDEKQKEQSASTDPENAKNAKNGKKSKTAKSVTAPQRTMSKVQTAPNSKSKVDGKNEFMEKWKADRKRERKNYGNYGTTFDTFTVCWEFNTFIGCKRGENCKWSHLYLRNPTTHPFTGEKLNGMAVRKFRIQNGI